MEASKEMGNCLGAAGLIAVAVCLSCACGAKSESARNAALGSSAGNGAELPLAHVDEAQAGTIYGSVQFQGQRPQLAAIDFSSNPQCERMHLKSEGPEDAERTREQTAIVNRNGTLRNVLVWIAGGLPEARWEPPAVAAKIDQVGCVYVPHVLGLMVNQELDIANSDPINHDVDVESKQNEPFNVLEPPRSQTIARRFVHQEVWFPVACGVHPWMKTYVAVVGHPFFAVTGAEGTFVLKGVPAGTYTIETVQEMYGRKRQQIVLAPKQVAKLDFTYVE